jgi:hypothetical protein
MFASHKGYRTVRTMQAEGHCGRPRMALCGPNYTLYKRYSKKVSRTKKELKKLSTSDAEGATSTSDAEKRQALQKALRSYQVMRDQFKPSQHSLLPASSTAPPHSLLEAFITTSRPRHMSRGQRMVTIANNETQRKRVTKRQEEVRPYKPYSIWSKDTAPDGRVFYHVHFAGKDGEALAFWKQGATRYLTYSELQTSAPDLLEQFELLK